MKYIILSLSLILSTCVSFGQFQRIEGIQMNGVKYSKLANLVTSLQELKTVSPIIGNTVHWNDTLQGGDFTVYARAGFTLDSGIVFPHSDANYVLVRNRGNAISVKACWFGMVPDGVTDNYYPYQ